MITSCIFCQIGETEADKHLYSDERCFVIRDVAPLASTHLLVISHQHITSLGEASLLKEPLVGHFISIAGLMARREKIHESGYRLVINQGRDAGQTVDHLHIHVMGGEQLSPIG